METLETLVTKYGPLFEEQLQIEEKAKQEAELKTRKNMERRKIEGVAGETVLASRFTGHVWDDCSRNIRVLVDEIRFPRKTTQGSFRKPMEDLLHIYACRESDLVEMLTVYTATAIMSRTLKEYDAYVDVSRVAYHAGDNIQREAEVEDFIQKEEVEGKDNARCSMDLGISQRVALSYKKIYARNRMNKNGYSGLRWTKADVVALGSKLIEAVVYGSGYWKMQTRQVDNKALMCITMTGWFKTAWESNVDKLVDRAVSYLPMVIPPVPWTTPYDGGYYGRSRLGTKLIRFDGDTGSAFAKRYSNLLTRVELSRVYKALNAMQETPFVINSFVLEVMQKLKESGGDFGGIPRMEPYDTLPELPASTTEEELKAHKKKLVGIYKAEAARKSRALRFLITLATAEKFKKYERIYFPWNIDYRGRCYPIPTALSPQGDDISKSLLLFANGTPIKEVDIKWLTIHGANLAGHDKVPFEERTKWILDNSENIIESANDPLGNKWWYEVSKGDYPLEFLAFCDEWSRLMQYKKDHGTADGFVSRLPLAFDGTCSGLQHFSALLRDEVGGHAVNLVPSDKVQDIYSIVAEKVNKVLTEDAKSGIGDSPKHDKKTGEVLKDSTGNTLVCYGTKTLAQNWMTFNRMKFNQDGITRKVCKRSVMTLAYGSKQYGFKENLLEDILKPFEQEHPDDFPFLSKTQAAVYMAKLIWDAVGLTVIKAVEGMSWLQTIAKLISKGDEVVTWFTPNGLPVQQNYLKEKTRVIKVRFGGGRVRLYTQEATDEVDGRAQANGVSPNFIHSMDATHLQRVVGAEKDLGNNNFMMIHDSFGTDAGHAGELYTTIRHEFVKLYSDHNYLEDFFENVKHLIPEDELSNVPPIPSFGKLAIQDVVDSEFCFA